MNSYMTTSTKNTKIFNIIDFMGRVNMMYVKFLFYRFTNKTLVKVMSKSSCPINSRPFSIVRVFNVMHPTRFIRIFNTFSRAKFSLLRLFCSKFNFTNRANNLFFSRRCFAGLFKALHCAIGPSFIFTSGYIGRSLSKNHAAFLATQSNSSFMEQTITGSRAILSSISSNNFLAGGTCFHMPRITLATVNVNNKKRFYLLPRRFYEKAKI